MAEASLFSNSPVIIGHRGASGYRPEHSEEAYRLAFELGADFVEPDIVATRDGHLVLRHENEISGTTDIAGHPEFSNRRTTKLVDGREKTGWFTEDFSWAELSTLRCVERLPDIRSVSASHDGRFGLLRLRDLLALVDETSDRIKRPLGLVAEIKHAQYFAELGLRLDELFADEITAAGWNTTNKRLVVESFEPTVLGQIREQGIHSQLVFLLATSGAPADLVAVQGSRAPSYASFLSSVGLATLSKSVDGVSIDKSLLMGSGLERSAAESGSATVSAWDPVAEAHAAGLVIYTWTLRPENLFLAPQFKRGSEPAEFGDWLGEFSSIIRTGVDGIFTDHPDLAVIARQATRG